MLPKKPKNKRSIVNPRDVTKPSQHPEPTEHTQEVLLHRNQPYKVVKVRSELPKEEREQLINLLVENADVFAIGLAAHIQPMVGFISPQVTSSLNLTLLHIRGCGWLCFRGRK